jgi:rubrerythrin
MAKGNLDELKSVLNRALTLEYTLIIHYPRLAAMIPDEATRKLASELGSASIKHADIVANAIIRLGGKPDWSFEPFPAKVNLVRRRRLSCTDRAPISSPIVHSGRSLRISPKKRSPTSRWCRVSWSG